MYTRRSIKNARRRRTLLEAGLEFASPPTFSNVQILPPWHNQSESATPSPESSSNAATLSYFGTVDAATAHTFLTGDTSSMQFTQATTARVDSPDAAYLTIGSNDFSIEAYVRFDTFTPDDTVNANNEAGMCIASQWFNGAEAFEFYIEETDGSIRFDGSTDGSNIDVLLHTKAITWALNTDYHVCVCRSGGVMRIFLDGVEQLYNTETNTTGALANSSLPLEIGGDQYRSGSRRFFVGFMAHFRFVNGEGVYNTDFLIPVDPHPTS
jgi:hypothetical protein